MELDNLTGATNHNGGALGFGIDGKLYVAVGDNATASNAQIITNRLGKILRINKDGTIPTDNPTTFPGITGMSMGLNRAIWTVGLRNPYTMAFQPVTGTLFVNEVGQSAKEEINNSTAAGQNFGWPQTEGVFNAANFPNYVNPVYDYGHASNTVGQGCSIIGGTFYNPTVPNNYPASFIGSYFFLDYCGSWIDRISIAPENLNARKPAETWVRTNFLPSISGGSVGLTAGPDANLYYLSRNTGALVQITSSAPLPIKLKEFTAKLVDNQKVILDWTTSVESNSDYFDIQKSNDLVKWNSIGKVLANNNSNEVLAYSFEDSQPANLNYYKLKMVDKDGRFEYSGIKTIKTNSNEATNIYPNPAEQIIRFNDVENTNEALNVYSISGQNVTQFVKFEKVENNIKTLNISKLAKGKYFINNKLGTKSFIKN
jgi:hypothetical protein